MSPRPITHLARCGSAAVLLLAALAATDTPRASYAAPAASGVRTITVMAAHPVFPKSIPAGALAVRLVTDTATPYSVGFLRVKKGVGIAQAQAASTDIIRLSRLVTFVGGEIVPAQRSATAVVNLSVPGRYAMHISGKQGDPGRTLLFAVTTGASPPGPSLTPDVTVAVRGLRFMGLPAHLRAGRIVFQVSNRSAGIRNMQVWRLDPGKTERDFLAAFTRRKDPAWLHVAGGMDVLSSRQTAWATLTLAPGRYVADCPLPDPSRGGRPFALEGLITSFTVS